jgi:hypothetical protein
MPNIFKFLWFQCQVFQRFLWRLCGISKGCVRSKPENGLSNFCPPNWAQKAVGAAQSSRQAVERPVCTLTGVSTFRKKMSSFVQRGNAPQAACANRPRMGFGNRMKQRLIHPARATERMPAGAAGSERRRGFRPARLNFRSTRISSGASQRACGLKSHAWFLRRRRPKPFTIADVRPIMRVAFLRLKRAIFEPERL